jgi:hypothetical protein
MCKAATPPGASWKAGQIVGALTFKETLEGNFLLNTGTTRSL